MSEPRATYRVTALKAPFPYPGVITTNLTLTELAAHLGRRAWDRLMQMAPAGQMVDMSGVPSWRVKAGGR